MAQGLSCPETSSRGDLADVLTKFLSSIQFRDMMAQQTTRLVTDLYSLTTIGRRTANFCESLLRG